MGVLWLSGRAEYILKCNMISSLLMLFLPPWLFFTAFKGMFFLSARPSCRRVSRHALVSLCSHHSLSLYKSSNNLSSFLVCHLSLLDTRATLLPAHPAHATSPPASPRHRAFHLRLMQWLSVALQSVSTAAARPVLSCPVLTQSIGTLLCGPSLLSPVRPSLPTAGLVCPDFL